MFLNKIFDFNIMRQLNFAKVAWKDLGINRVYTG